MDVQTALKALRLIRQARVASSNPARRAALRIAARWLVAGMKDDYDAMLRLQVLEGAAGVPVNSWWKKGKRGFKPANDHFAATSIQPIWLEPSNSGMVNIVDRILSAALRSFKVPLDTTDILNNSLMGLTIDAAEQKGYPAYEAGKAASAGIRSGKETPSSIGKGVLGTYLKRKVSNESKRFKGESMPSDDEGRPYDIHDNNTTMRGEVDLPADFISKLVFRAKGDPLGKKIRAKIRGVFDTAGKNYQGPMTDWLNEAEKGHFLDLDEMMERANWTKSKSAFSLNLWKKSWIDVMKAIWGDKALVRDIELRLEAEGFHGGIEKPDPNDPSIMKGDPMMLLRPKKKAARQLSASRQMLARVVTRWLSSNRQTPDSIR